MAGLEIKFYKTTRQKYFSHWRKGRKEEKLKPRLAFLV
jgi:hypothetical protein